ncbi:transporter [Nanchangia anserum]|uniref:Transporter n=1 Tax=Nanchangia anserum TaxID=2692125 RepID=A0A8I0GE87_9ACTO|nr:TrkA C-terminal domain-containing protein [Nanchangia anserum]MBD3689247.1 transporter [Nanchangia anserum]QOX81470.1 transporter [Nanchangia anserum]
MSSLLAANPLLTIFLVITLGALLGSIRFGPIKLGAAGALFIGLAVGALVPETAQGLELIQAVGLALFVYTVGLAAGATFFRDITRQGGLFAAAAAILVVVGAAAWGIGRILGVDVDYITGAYAGALTSTPALAAANDAAGSVAPGVGYAIGYPVGVVVTILVVAAVVTRSWPATSDTPSLAGASLEARTIAIDSDTALRRIPGWQEGTVRLSYLQRAGRTRVVSPGEELLAGDRVLLVSAPDHARAAIEWLGHEVDDEHLEAHRDEVDFRYFLVSRKELAGRSVGELGMASRFGGIIMRVQRGDLELLAADDLSLELGDRVLVVASREELGGVAQFFGDSQRDVSEVDPLGLGLGMLLGLVAGLLSFTLPGGAPFTLGMACGPLIVGMILGALQRTGPLVWVLPQAANLTVRQLGLLIFLVAVGLASGPAFAANAFTLEGVKIGGIALVVVAASAAAIVAAGRLLGLSAQRTAGALAGFVGQPAILAYASARVADERIEAGYAALFAYAIIIKILCIAAIAAFA